MPRTGEPIHKVTTASGETRYEARADWTDPRTGVRRHMKRRFPRHADARKWRASVLSGTAEELRPAPAPEAEETVSDAVAPWLEVKRRTVRYVTFRNYERDAAVWTERLGDRPLRSITKADIEALVNEYQDSGRSVARVGKLLMVIRAVLEDALHEGRIDRNPAARVKARGKAPVPRRRITREHLVAIREALSGDRLEALGLLSLAGLRRSEVLGLKWSDVDLESGVLSIRRARVQVGGSARIDVTPPKTRTGERDLPLPRPLVTALRALRDAQMQELGLGHVRGGWVAVHEDGEPIRPEAYSDWWALLLEGAGVPHFTLHEARHTSVSEARDAGQSSMDVAAWHGHTEAVMQRVYSHASEDSLRAVGDALFGTPDPGSGDAEGTGSEGPR